MTAPGCSMASPPRAATQLCQILSALATSDALIREAVLAARGPPTRHPTTREHFETPDAATASTKPGYATSTKAGRSIRHYKETTLIKQGFFTPRCEPNGCARSGALRAIPAGARSNRQSHVPPTREDGACSRIRCLADIDVESQAAPRHHAGTASTTGTTRRPRCCGRCLNHFGNRCIISSP